jgi:hypothetical protein
VVKKLLTRGADVNIIDGYGHSVLGLAEQVEHGELTPPGSRSATNWQQHFNTIWTLLLVLT